MQNYLKKTKHHILEYGAIETVLAALDKNGIQNLQTYLFVYKSEESIKQSYQLSQAQVRNPKETNYFCYNW
jgi:hypothetical protein